MDTEKLKELADQIVREIESSFTETEIGFIVPTSVQDWEKHAALIQLYLSAKKYAE